MTVIENPRAARYGSDFRRSLDSQFRQYLTRQEARFDASERLSIDLHCHDHNSDVPDELWGRILGLPETWLKTGKLVKCLRANGSDVITITNHNNARSCWELLDKGEDVLVGCEFTCYFPEYELYCHVLTYGFTPEQEVILQRKRQNIYEFLRYVHLENIPVILPHPLYFYAANKKIDLTLFEKLALMFQRFEVLNGQRDLWQSVLTLNWAEGLTAQKMSDWSRKHKIDPAEFGVDIEAPKVLTGGSDDHMGIFAGQCGTRLWVPNLQQRLQTEKPSELALEAIRAGHMSPFGHVGENQKLNIALLDYFAQIATRIEDPGLLRILLHRGETRDKVACFEISNLLLELQKRKHSRKFFEFVHDALQGRKPNKMLKWGVSRKYHFCIDHLERIADSRRSSPEEFVETVNTAISEIFDELNSVVVRRIGESGLITDEHLEARFSTEELTRNLEIPSQISALFMGGSSRYKTEQGRKLHQLIDSLSFPLLISMVLAGATLTSTRVLYQNRHFLNQFATRIGQNHHACRALHLTDTLFDRNGVSNSLTAKLNHCREHDLPIDFLVCHETEEEAAHLKVVRPIAGFTLPDSGGQRIRIPNLMEVARAFYEGGYDRIVCSTEGPMVLVALYLKHMFNVPCYFFMHTDWIEYIKRTTNATRHERDRVRRMLRLLYSQFDGVFVLNTEHRNWLIGYEMQLEAERIHITAHQAPQVLSGIQPVDKRTLFPDATSATPVLFIASRLSREKGLFDLPEVLRRCRESLPDLRLVIAGSGPAEEELREALPDAHFTGWINREQLGALYAGLDLFVFPSRFDTFGNVLLESFAHGMPAVAYNCKGPADIIEAGRSGFLAEDIEDMAAQIVAYFQSPLVMTQMRQGALQRAADYSPEQIMSRYLTDLGLPSHSGQREHRIVA